MNNNLEAEVDVARLKQRINSSGFSMREKQMLLDVLQLNDYAPHHTYPGGRRGSSPYETIAWEILDHLPPAALKVSDRFILGRKIVEALKFVDYGVPSAVLEVVK